MTTRDRLTLGAAIAVALASSALRGVYEDLGWLLPVLGGIVAVSGASALARLARAPRPLQPLAGLLGLVAYAAVTSAWSTLAYGLLPTFDTVASLVETVRGAVADVQQLAAPVPTREGLVLLAVLGTGAITVAVDLLAVVLRRVAASGLPLLLLFAVPSSVLQGGLGLVPFLLGAAGWLGLLLADGSDRASRWGTPLRSAASQTDPGLSRVGRRIGAAALGVAAVVPAVVPGLDGGLLIGNGTGPGGGGARSTTTYNPLLSLAGQLRQPVQRELFTYRSAAGPDYLRLTTLDVFDPDRGWSSSELSADLEDDAVQDGVPVSRSLTFPTETVAVEVELARRRLGGPWLPVPATPTEIAIDGPWLWDAEAETAFSTRTSVRDVDDPYTVRTLRVQHDVERLRRPQTVPNEIAEVYAQRPELSEETTELLKATTAGADSDFDRVAAIQRMFQGPSFTYSESTSVPPTDAPDALTAFLRTRRGFCEQYASAMAALVRGLGMPARVAVGFTTGEQIGPGTYRVTTREAHAWPEVWFRGAGWVRFEPTPRSGEVDVPDYSTALPAAEEEEDETTTPLPGATSTLPSASASAGPVDRAAQDGLTGTTDSGGAVGGSPWLLAVPGVLLLLALPAALTALRRRRTWRTPDALAAWASVRDDAADIGHRWRPADSPRAAAAQLLKVRRLPEPAVEALHRLASGAERARYARSGNDHDPVQLRSDARLVRAAVHATATPRARWLARLAPPSTVRWASHGVGTAVADLLDRLDSAGAAVTARLRRPRRAG